MLNGLIVITESKLTKVKERVRETSYRIGDNVDKHLSELNKIFHEYEIMASAYNEKHGSSLNFSPKVLSDVDKKLMLINTLGKAAGSRDIFQMLITSFEVDSMSYYTAVESFKSLVNTLVKKENESPQITMATIEDYLSKRGRCRGSGSRGRFSGYGGKNTKRERGRGETPLEEEGEK